MSNLVNILNKNGQLVVTSRQIAEDFEKEHNDTKKRIRELVKDMGEISHNYFILSDYTDSMNRKQEEYLLTRDGFSLLVMGFTGPKALEWKLKYIESFNKMEKVIKEAPLSMEDMMIKQLEEQKKIKAEISSTKEDVKILEYKVDNQITLDHGQQRVIQREVAKRVYERLQYNSDNVALGNQGEYSNLVNELRENINKVTRRYFNSLYKEIKNRFGVGSYRDIKIKDFELAINYIRNWIEPQELRKAS